MEDIALLPAHAALALIQGGKLSCRELTGACLAQIERLDPILKGFITVRAEAVLREAREMDERYACGERLPLHGLTLAVKDVIPTAGIRTTFGVPDLMDNVPDFDTGYVTKLKQAGAIIIGKTSTPEYAAYVNTRNKIVGTTVNPWNLQQSSGGSSGGTAVAVATGMAALGIGTDYGGSVRFPAGLTGTVGLRGTPGLIPPYPSLWGWDTFAVPGPMCRTVADTDLMLRHMSGPDPRSPLPPVAAYAGPENVDARKLRIAWSEDLDKLFPVEAEVRRAMQRAMSDLQQAGVRVVEAAPPLHGIHESIVPQRSLRTLILHATRLDQTDKMSNRLLAHSIERAKKATALEVAQAEIVRGKVWDKAVSFFDMHDILVCPTSQFVGFDKDVAAPTKVDGVEFSEPLFSAMCTYAITMLGWPCLVVPCGFASTGEPIGVQLIAPLGREDRLMAFGLFLENVMGWTNKLPPMARGTGISH